MWEQYRRRLPRLFRVTTAVAGTATRPFSVRLPEVQPSSTSRRMGSTRRMPTAEGSHVPHSDCRVRRSEALTQTSAPMRCFSRWDVLSIRHSNLIALRCSNPVPRCHSHESAGFLRILEIPEQCSYGRQHDPGRSGFPDRSAGLQESQSLLWSGRPGSQASAFVRCHYRPGERVPAQRDRPHRFALPLTMFFPRNFREETFSSVT